MGRLVGLRMLGTRVRFMMFLCLISGVMATTWDMRQTRPDGRHGYRAACRRRHAKDEGSRRLSWRLSLFLSPEIYRFSIYSTATILHYKKACDMRGGEQNTLAQKINWLNLSDSQKTEVLEQARACLQEQRQEAQSTKIVSS